MTCSKDQHRANCNYFGMPKGVQKHILSDQQISEKKPIDDLTVGEDAETQKERWKHFNWTIKVAFNLFNSFIYLLFI